MSQLYAAAYSATAPKRAAADRIRVTNSHPAIRAPQSAPIVVTNSNPTMPGMAKGGLYGRLRSGVLRKLGA
jgi:hypothetical protein